MAALIEKRKERRIRVELPTKIVYQNTEITGETKNISRLGAYTQTDKEIPSGADIDITLIIPAYTKELSLSGEIRCKASVFRANLVRELNHKKYYGIGIFFTDFLQQANKDKLDKYIAFLILQERQGINKGLRQWREKRDMAKKSKRLKQMEVQDDNYQGEVVILLKQVLSRLDEIYHLLKSQNKSS